MSASKKLIEISTSVDRAACAAEFKTTGRLQMRNVLTPKSAAAVQNILQHQTPWGLAWQSGADGPNFIRHEQLAKLGRAETAAIERKLVAAVQGRDYAFAYFSYPLVEAYLNRWQPGSPQEQLLEEINSASFLGLIRDVTGVAETVKADGQATLYAPGHFLSHHDDSEPERGRRIAYVLSMAHDAWRPEWGGYLNFYDQDWDVEQAFRPRFNALNLFTVPQVHSVTQVAAAAPIGRYAVTGWARDR